MTADGGGGPPRPAAAAGRTGREDPAAGDGVVVVGAGRVGQSVAGRSPRPPELLAGRAGIGWIRLGPGDGPGPAGGSGSRDRPPDGPGDTYRPPWGGAAGAGTLLLCVPDDALADAARAWAVAAAPRMRAPSPGEPGTGTAGEGDARSAGAGPVGDARTGARSPEGEPPAPAPVALHTSGVHGPEALSPLRDAGRAVGSWHPLTALAAPRADAFRGVTFGLAGDDPAVERGRALAREVDGRFLRVAEGENARYHAAAVFASNHLVACLEVARRELEAATDAGSGLDDGTGLGALLPLARAALENLASAGPSAGATGPVARGDVGTVRRHLRALDPETARLYRGLARELLGLVEGRLDPGTADALRSALEGDPA